jgi:hypothetical protein
MTTPTTALTFSAVPQELGSRWGSQAERPEGQRHALEAYTRLQDSRRRVEAQMWAARIPVIVAQLRVMRGTYPE